MHVDEGLRVHNELVENSVQSMIASRRKKIGRTNKACVEQNHED